MRTTKTKLNSMKQPDASSKEYTSWDAYVQAKVERANKRLSRIDLTKITGAEKKN